MAHVRDSTKVSKWETEPWLSLTLSAIHLTVHSIGKTRIFPFSHLNLSKYSLANGSDQIKPQILQNLYALSERVFCFVLYVNKRHGLCCQPIQATADLSGS
jgi:hypothetical protein